MAGEEARLSVVEEVALADGLDDEGVLGRRGRGGRAGGGEFSQGRGLGRVDDVRRDRGVLGAELIRKRLQSSPGVPWFFCPAIEDKGTTT